MLKRNSAPDRNFTNLRKNVVPFDLIKELFCIFKIQAGCKTTGGNVVILLSE